MGSNMCVDEHAHSLLIENGKKASQQDFQPSKWPNDPFLMKQLKYSSIAAGQSKDKPYKVKYQNKYYWGGWSNGKPKGKGIYYINQPNKIIYYEGQIDQEPNGRGKLIVNQGQWEYQGQVNNGQAHGRGKMINRKQGITFDGDWLDSKPVKGQLILYDNKIIPEGVNNQNVKGVVIDYDINKHENTIKYPDGRIYTGQIQKKNYAPHGIGKVVLPDKSEYIGEWHMGKMHGVGKFQWSDGSCYSGDYSFGKRHGNGKFSFPNGNSYNGGWKEGKQQGQGVLTDKNGQILSKGFWKEGNFIGQHP